jgi:hypothetical protein
MVYWSENEGKEFDVTASSHGNFCGKPDFYLVFQKVAELISRFQKAWLVGI